MIVTAPKRLKISHPSAYDFLGTTSNSSTPEPSSGPHHAGGVFPLACKAPCEISPSTGVFEGFGVWGSQSSLGTVKMRPRRHLAV